ncbi:hypothetical protein ACHHYP_08949 [Achlya hypogyna]|uniref:Uncharacterized protein n=1 Tax=Achlya hypogyna TaxID=1202772 RepID=A0A1V9ZJU5_ACHHY|nr:hypothetical protein ACHHYP_08949 [Achlya hypogyna]
MSLAVRPTPYPGTTLVSLADFVFWKRSFLAHAALFGLCEYFTTPDYTDPELADYVSPAKMHLLMDEADHAVPAPEPESSPELRVEARARRKRLVSDHVTQAVLAECAAIKVRTMRVAKDYLLGAVGRELYGELSTLETPYDMWSRLCAMGSAHEANSDVFSLMVAALSSTYTPGTEALNDFLDRYEAGVDALLVPLLAPTLEPSSAILAYQSVVADRLKASLLAHAFETTPGVNAMWTTWRRKEPSWTS